MRKIVLGISALGVAMFVLILVQIGSVLFASAVADSDLNTSTLSYAESRSTQPFLLRYMRTGGLEPAEVFALAPGTEGGTLARIGGPGWSGTLEVLRPDCSVVGSLPIPENSNTYVAVWEDGRPERVMAFDVIDGETDAALPATGRCR